MIPEEDIIKDRLKAKSRVMLPICDCGCGFEIGSEDFINLHVPKCEFCGNPVSHCVCMKGGYDPEYD